MTNKEGHYKLWDELARTGGGFWAKHETFDCLFPDVKDVGANSCFACIETGFTLNEKKCIYVPTCRNCPIKWGNKSRTFQCEKTESPYLKWRKSNDPEERKRLAALIRDLPWEERRAGR